jgi:hypothetical protein
MIYDIQQYDARPSVTRHQRRLGIATKLVGLVMLPLAIVADTNRVTTTPVSQRNVALQAGDCQNGLNLACNRVRWLGLQITSRLAADYAARAKRSAGWTKSTDSAGYFTTLSFKRTDAHIFGGSPQAFGIKADMMAGPDGSPDPTTVQEILITTTESATDLQLSPIIRRDAAVVTLLRRTPAGDWWMCTMNDLNETECYSYPYAVLPGIARHDATDYEFDDAHDRILNSYDRAMNQE